MGNPKAFLNIPRQEAGYRPIHERISDSNVFGQLPYSICWDYQQLLLPSS